MTIEEAIEYLKDSAKESRESALSYARKNDYETAISCKAVGYAHEQIADWLAELKQLREDANKQPKTNGDCIRLMADEELADIVQFWLQCDHCPINDGECHVNCYLAAMEWLKQEVQEDEVD